MRFGGTRRIHFVGIGGSGMSGIAEILLNMGYEITGSDLARSEAVLHLEKAGARIRIGHSAENIENADVVVISSAVSGENPEVISAREQLIPVIPRAEMLAELMRMKHSIAVAGSHGKTTTTTMTAMTLAKGGFDPTIVIGGRVDRLGSGAKLGEGDYLVAEADESDGSFLSLYPTVAVVTNIDNEHIDHYGSFEKIKISFAEFVNKVPFYGAAILCLDDPNIQEIIPQLKKRFVTFGVNSTADVTAQNIRFDRFRSTFDVIAYGEPVGTLSIDMPGIHNVYNALAAVTVGIWLKMDTDDVMASLDKFAGIQRRLQNKGEIGGVMVLDDYGHHPSEVMATLRGVKNGFPGRRLVVVFQPHRYSRTRDQMELFHTAFYDADELLILPIYSAGEKPIEGVRAEDIAEGVSRHGKKGVRYCAGFQEALAHLVGALKEGDIVLTMGAGDIAKFPDTILAELVVEEKE